MAEKFNTLEEAQAAYDTLEASSTSLAKQVSDLTAERDSLNEENQQLKTDYQNQSNELNEAKKLNFTLARAVNVQKEKRSPEECIYDMFFKK